MQLQLEVLEIERSFGTATSCLQLGVLRLQEGPICDHHQAEGNREVRQLLLTLQDLGNITLEVLLLLLQGLHVLHEIFGSPTPAPTTSPRTSVPVFA